LNRIDGNFSRVAVLIAILAGAPLHAQQTGVSGRVVDPSKAVVVGTKVTAKAEDGTVVATTTNGAGLYQFPGLRAGTYVLRFEATGFAPGERTVPLLVGQTATADESRRHGERFSSGSTRSAIQIVARPVIGIPPPTKRSVVRTAG